MHVRRGRSRTPATSGNDAVEGASLLSALTFAYGVGVIIWAVLDPEVWQRWFFVNLAAVFILISITHWATRRENARLRKDVKDLALGLATLQHQTRTHRVPSGTTTKD